MHTNRNNLSQFMKAYEKANNSHTWANVEPFIANDASYWFTDGSFSGIEEIKGAIQRTFDKIQDEIYTIPTCTGQYSPIRWRYVLTYSIGKERLTGSSDPDLAVARMYLLKTVLGGKLGMSISAFSFTCQTL